MKYFRLKDDIYYPQRWHLGSIINIDNWVFHEHHISLPNALNIELIQDGCETDFTFTAAYIVPIVSEKMKDALMDVKNIRFEPVSVLDRQCSSKYFVMITEETIDCIDEKNSVFDKFQVNDPVRPDLAGKYRVFFDMKVDENKISNSDVFRIENYNLAIIFSEKIVTRLKSLHLTGFKFDPVN